MEIVYSVFSLAAIASTYFLWQIATSLIDLLKEVKGLRIQLQETFTPEDLDKGHYGYPKVTHQLVEKLLAELRQQGRQS